MNHESAKAHKPAISHLIWWFLFANGGGLAALVLPIHILVQGVLGPWASSPWWIGTTTRGSASWATRS
jgi:fumarate reductase subunit D